MKRDLTTKFLVALSVCITLMLSQATIAQKKGDKASKGKGEIVRNGNGNGATLLVDDFTYTTGSLLTANGWTAHSGAGTNALATVTPGLTLTGYPGSGVGNAVAMTVTGEDVNKVFTVQTAGSVYAAAMVNLSEASTDPVGGYFFHLGPDPISTTFRGRVFAKKDGTGAVAFGISKSLSTAADVVYTPFSYSLNTTYLIVLKYTIVDGTANDTVSLWVDTTVPTAEPAATVTATDVAQSDINPGSVAIRQGSTTTAPTLNIDGVRIGNSWESVTQGTVAPPSDAPVDMNGDGKSDFVLVRDVSGQLTWLTQLNGGTAVGAAWGLPTDAVVSEDFDGDGKDDVAVWREDAQSNFYILQSATSTLKADAFGTTSDDPTIVGDYDGDGKADVAVYRASNSTFYYRGTLNNVAGNITFHPWGTIGDNPYPGDFDGDGKMDVCVYQGGGTKFILRRSSDFGVEFIEWGLSSDLLIPGDYDGDGKTDFCVRRFGAGGYEHYILERDGGGTGGSPILFGTTGDLSVPGDYDGDGKTDIAVWRSGIFYVRSTASGAVSFTAWGAAGDYAVAESVVH